MKIFDFQPASFAFLTKVRNFAPQNCKTSKKEYIIIASLVDESYYRNVYKGAEVYDDLPTLFDRASDIVRQHTLFRLEDVDSLPFFMQENVKKAVCSQAEFIDQNGVIVWDTPYAQRQYYLESTHTDKNPNAQMMWAHKARDVYVDQWLEVYKKAFKL